MEVFPYFGGILHPVVSFIVSLSIIVFVHEYGHYIVGKWSGIKADVFSVGMGPVILSRVDKNGTTWQIAAIPFGGSPGTLSPPRQGGSRIPHAFGWLCHADAAV